MVEGSEEEEEGDNSNEMTEYNIVLHPALHVAGNHRTQETEEEPEVESRQCLLTIERSIQ